MSTICNAVRTLLLALAVAMTAPAAARSESTARATGRSAVDTPVPVTDGTSLDGAALIVGIVAVIILLAWVCSRVSDSD